MPSQTMMSSTNSDYVVQDLDEELSFHHALDQIADVRSNNFAIYFDHKRAFAATNLTTRSLAQWTNDHEKELGTKWIHFWTDSNQRTLIEALASRYDISPRLVALLCPQAGGPIARTRIEEDTLFNDSLAQTSPKGDVRHGIESIPNENETGVRSVRTTNSGLKEVTFGEIVNDLWHFHSVDWGKKYIHVGVNVLSVVPGLSHSVDKPAGQRLWMSLVLGHDGSVISTLQRPSILEDSNIGPLANKIGKRHILNVLSQISRLASKHVGEGTDLTGIRVRPSAKSCETSSDVTVQESSECASLLFYYLFDDWSSTYALIARREHPYRKNLEEIRQVLTTAPDVYVLESLHNIGRQLTVLRSMYRSYAAVVTRLLTRHNSTVLAIPAMGIGYENTGNKEAMFENSNTPSHIYSAPTSILGQRSSISHRTGANTLVQTAAISHPTLSSAALFRFERLLDRIDLYALSEINESLAEKESLSLMTFNLLTLSESFTIEKLTRTTILLAKATILFLPTSLLTAYFGISIGNIATKYSLKTYWLSFLVVVITSVVFLSMFQFATGSVQRQLGFVSLHHALWRKVMAKWMKRRKEKEADA